DQEKDETIRAIQKVVSLELYNQLLKDIEKMYNDMTREIKTKTSDKQIEELFEKLEKVSNELEEIEKKSTELSNEIELLSNEEQTKQRERRQLIANNSLTKQNLSKAIGQNEQALNNIERELKNAKSEDLQKLILQPSINNLKRKLKQEKAYLDAKARESAKFAPYEDFINELLGSLPSASLTENQKEEIKQHGKKVWAKINQIQQSIISKEVVILHDLSQGDYQKILNTPETRTT